MVSYIDVAFLAVTVLMVLINARRGLIVSLVGMIRFIIVAPAAYFLSRFVKPYVPSYLMLEVPEQIRSIIIFVACLLALLILSELLVIILKKLQNKKGMPLRHTNAFLGGVFGFVKALVFVFVIGAVLGSALEFIPESSQLYDPINSSIAVQTVNSINPFDLIGG